MKTQLSARQTSQRIFAIFLSILVMLAIAAASTASNVKAAAGRPASTWILAASGDLDPTFSGDGKVTTAFIAGQPARAWDLAIQGNGRIVVVGDTVPSATNSNIALARYTAAGILDPTFNTTGKKVINLGGNEQGLDVVIQPTTGKIIVAGQKCASNWDPCNAAVLRLNPNGSFDTTFNGTGRRIDDFGGGDNGSTAVALYPGGRIIAAGYMFNGVTGNYDMSVIRYTAAGALDATFSGDGKQSVGFGPGRLDEAQGIAVQADGKILIGGRTCDSSHANCNFALARLNANGSLDTTFNGIGRQVTNFGASEAAWSLALRPDGRIVLAGSKDTATTSYIALARYNSNGSLDNTFAGTGKQVTDFSGDAKRDFAVGLLLQGDGKSVACGSVFGDSAVDFAVARYTGSGLLDVTFSSDGKAIVDFGGDDRCLGIARQVDGKYVMAGSSEAGGLKRWVVARVLP